MPTTERWISRPRDGSFRLCATSPDNRCHEMLTPGAIGIARSAGRRHFAAALAAPGMAASLAAEPPHIGAQRPAVHDAGGGGIRPAADGTVRIGTLLVSSTTVCVSHAALTI